MDKQTLLSHLSPDIEQIDAAMTAEFAAIGSPKLAMVVRHAIFNGGKRIRPLLTMLTARLATYSNMPEGLASEEDLTPPSDLYRLAMVFELLHGASLLHDDVIDHAELRRGTTTAHAKWGKEVAILAGDYLHTRAMTLAGTIGNSRCLDLIGSATAAMIDAEFLQALAQEEQDPREETYFAILRGKTGALISSACEVGAIFAEASPEQRQALRTYGDGLGLAFQMVDDLLDYQGDPERTGKEVGNDFQEGKMTLPLLHALDNSPAEQRQFLLELLAAGAGERQEKFARAREIISEAGGFSYTREGAEALIDAALEALAIFPECQAKETLSNLGHYVLSRDK
ncbi:MAG: polyprenyl synthetase family protein [Thermodesulfobacteriota bacterium]